MEYFAQWYLYHRDNEELIELAKQCGIDESCITIEEEPLGLNLFMRIKKYLL